MLALVPHTLHDRVRTRRKGVGGCPAPQPAAVLHLDGQSCQGGRQLSLLALHQELGNWALIVEGKEASEADLLLEQIKVTQSLIAAATQPRGRNRCPRFAFYFHGQNAGGMLSTHCSLGRKVHCCLCLSSCILLFHQLAASDRQVSVVPGVGSAPTPPWRLPAAALCQEEHPAAGKSFFMIYLFKVICKLQKEASVNAVLLMLVARLCLKPQHSWFSCFCALWCPGTVWILGGLWETCQFSPPQTLTWAMELRKESYWFMKAISHVFQLQSWKNHENPCFQF